LIYNLAGLTGATTTTTKIFSLAHGNNIGIDAGVGIQGR